MKFYFLHIKSDEVGTTLKHPETINGNVINLRKDKGNANFYLPLINCQRFWSNPLKKNNLACWWGLVPTRSSQVLLLPSPTTKNTNDKKKLKKLKKIATFLNKSRLI
jgi:hypothetical protein